MSRAWLLALPTMLPTNKVTKQSERSIGRRFLIFEKSGLNSIKLDQDLTVETQDDCACGTNLTKAVGVAKHL